MTSESPFKGQDVGGDAVEEPAVVRDDHGRSGKALQALFKGAEGVYVEVVVGSSRSRTLPLRLEHHGQVETVAFTTGEEAALFLLVCPAKLKRAT